MNIEIIDANNVLGAGIFSGISGAVKHSSPAITLCNVLIERLRKERILRIIAIFDNEIENVPSVSRLTILSPPKGKTADDLIKSLIREQHHKSNVTVISNDTELWNFARLHGFVAKTPKDWYAGSFQQKQQCQSVHLPNNKEKPLGTSRNDIRSAKEQFSRPLNDDDWDDMLGLFETKKRR